MPKIKNAGSWSRANPPQIHHQNPRPVDANLAAQGSANLKKAQYTVNTLRVPAGCASHTRRLPWWSGYAPCHAPAAGQVARDKDAFSCWCGRDWPMPGKAGAGGRWGWRACGRSVREVARHLRTEMGCGRRAGLGWAGLGSAGPGRRRRRPARRDAPVGLGWGQVAPARTAEKMLHGQMFVSVGDSDASVAMR
ncbi:hypothetical protein BT67DRAFT_118125 [Trichocladium antarcticum]|uniref:Uncharacterized protein n=1 Tax=Trichocladium antarcticum TaxID=1450529 RepID=A0AAN6UR65_9PEZI|nr:hypothetical protein BT67DRAFT_118125 [Trichocladium antarcticum]